MSWNMLESDWVFESFNRRSIIICDELEKSAGRRLQLVEESTHLSIKSELLRCVLESTPRM